MKNEKVLSLLCNCQCSNLVFQYEYDDFYSSQDQVYVSLFERHDHTKLSFKERLRWIWHILKTGDLWKDHTILVKEDIAQLRDFCNEVLYDMKILRDHEKSEFEKDILPFSQLSKEQLEYLLMKAKERENG